MVGLLNPRVILKSNTIIPAFEVSNIFKPDRTDIDMFYEDIITTAENSA